MFKGKIQHYSLPRHTIQGNKLKAFESGGTNLNGYSLLMPCYYSKGTWSNTQDKKYIQFSTKLKALEKNIDIK